MSEHYDAVVVGAGFYGLSVALYLKRFMKKVLVVDKEKEAMLRASFANQARVHGGYHYPRSITTGFRSQASYKKFLVDYSSSIEKSFKSYYAIAKRGSHVSAKQFVTFCQRIEAPLREAPASVLKEFDDSLIESVFEVQECAFDSVKLKQQLVEKCASEGIEIRCNFRLHSVKQNSDTEICIESGSATLLAKKVFLCAYSGLNGILGQSDIEFIPLKQEFTEMALVEAPGFLKDSAVTVMCGPFFSIMPFPSAGLHSFSHVRYTPHFHWDEKAKPLPRESGDEFYRSAHHSQYIPMLKDSERYLPCLKETKYRRSLYELKSILPRNDTDDGRPILFSRDHGIKNLFCILGAKIDNIYDVYQEIDALGFERVHG